MLVINRTAVRSLALCALALSAAACQSGVLANRAVVIYDRTRMGDAERTAKNLTGEGVFVDLQVRAPVPRSTSSIAVYDVARHPDRPQVVADLLAPVGKFELLPFPAQNGGTDIVVWLEEEHAEVVPDAVEPVHE
jgi:hypothetical protein